MTERAMVMMAALTALGAFVPGPVPRLPLVILIVLAFIVRSPPLLIVSVAVLASAQSAAAWQAVEPVAAARTNAEVELLTDPTPSHRGVQVDVELDGERLEAWAFGSAAGRLYPLLAGDRVRVVGRVTPRPPDLEWLAHRGVRGRLAIESINAISPATGPSGLANSLRTLVDHGASSLDPGQRALLTGFVYGDDRYQHDDDRDLFRAVGLGHLLAVSGQNVAFFLALVAPGLGRLTFGWRVPATVILLFFFALLTRFEPSVMRATVMAGGAAVAAGLGREASSRRLLPLTATGLILHDPLIVHRLAFQLSVAASAGILWVSPALADWFPGPRVLRTALAVTMGAQIAVAPLIAVMFGGVPIASIPANLLAGPVSGPIMAWGMTAGLFAGALGGTAASVIHLPSRAMLWWVTTVARAVNALGLGDLGPAHLAALAVIVAWWRLGQAQSGRRPRMAPFALAVVLAHPTLVSLLLSG